MFILFHNMSLMFTYTLAHKPHFNLARFARCSSHFHHPVLNAYHIKLS
jgi:hypothetical protein